MTHGARHELSVAPVRELHYRALLDDYPELDVRRAALLADRLARIELARAWLDRQDGVVRNDDGDVFGVVPHLEKWATRAEQILRDLEEERAARADAGSLGRLAEAGRVIRERRGSS